MYKFIVRLEPLIVCLSQDNIFSDLFSASLSPAQHPSSCHIDISHLHNNHIDIAHLHTFPLRFSHINPALAAWIAWMSRKIPITYNPWIFSYMKTLKYLQSKMVMKMFPKAEHINWTPESPKSLRKCIPQKNRTESLPVSLKMIFFSPHLSLEIELTIRDIQVFIFIRVTLFSALTFSAFHFAASLFIVVLCCCKIPQGVEGTLILFLYFILFMSQHFLVDEKDCINLTSFLNTNIKLRICIISLYALWCVPTLLFHNFRSITITFSLFYL